MHRILTPRLSLHSHVPCLKHDLNARAVAPLQLEFSQIEDHIEILIFEMYSAIARSDAVIERMP